MRLLPPALLVLVLLALAPTADAAQVSVDRRCENPTHRLETCGNVLTFEAAPGEANNVTAEPSGAGEFVVRDAGAPLTARGLCKQIDAASARCPDAPGVLYVTGGVTLGDGNDRLALPAAITLPVAGGAGDDVMSAAGIVRGGDGNDTLSGRQLDGGAGNDTLNGTAGADKLFGDVGDDTIDGGPGIDTAEYGVRPSFGAIELRTGPAVPVTVDLADPAPDGAAGEADALLAIENVTASAAAGDVLRGDSGPNVLEGNGGADNVFGGGGDDKLSGEGELDGGDGDDRLTGDLGADLLRGGDGNDRILGDGGPDVMEGGAGDDLLDANEYEPERTTDVDQLRCGAGRDRVAKPDIYDRAVSCERIAVGGGLVVDSATLVKRSGPRIEVVVRCARSGRRCSIQVASAAASGTAFNPPLRVRLGPGARRKLVLDRFHHGAKTRLRRANVIAFGTKDHGFAVRLR